MTFYAFIQQQFTDILVGSRSFSLAIVSINQPLLLRVVIYSKPVIDKNKSTAISKLGDHLGRMFVSS